MNKGRRAAVVLAMAGGLALPVSPVFASSVAVAPADAAPAAGTAQAGSSATGTAHPSTAPDTSEAPGTRQKATVAAGFTITGTAFLDRNRDGVRDTTEKPLAGGYGLSVNGTTTTADDSGFQVTDVPAGPVTLSLVGLSDGYSATPLTRELTADLTIDIPVISVVPGNGGTAPTASPTGTSSPTTSPATTAPTTAATTRSGEVTFQGKPMATTLTFLSQNETKTTATSGADGRYTVDLAAGRYTVTVAAPDAVKGLVKATSDPITVEVSGDTVTTIELPTLDRDCTTTDFRSVQDAQTLFDRYKGTYGDILKLDEDNDGKVCEAGLENTGAYVGDGSTTAGTDSTGGTAARTVPSTSAKALARTGTDTLPAVLAAAGLIGTGIVLRTAQARRRVRVRAGR